MLRGVCAGVFLLTGLTVCAGSALAIHRTDAAPASVATAAAHPSQVLVRFHAWATPADIAKAKGAAGATATLIEYTLVPGLQCVQVPAGTVAEALLALRADPAVKYAEPDYLKVADVQDTPYGITMVNAPATWTAGGNTPQARGAGAVVAVLDTGVDTTHPDLPAALLAESFIAGEAVEDLHTHGTHCAGTVLARDNADGVIGVAPSAGLMVGKVLSNSGYGSDAGVLAGVNWAVANGADVVSMSLGGGDFSQAFADGVIAANAAGVVVVAAAGNDNSSTPSYPASYPGVISVAAIDSAMARASFSNFGPLISVSAPGVGVQSSVPVITLTTTWSGTPRASQTFTGGKVATVTGQAIYCDIGDDAGDFPPTVSGNIAHIRRGSNGGPAVTFNTKVTNAVNAGAIGVILSNNNGGLFTGTLNGTFGVPVVSITQAQGDELQGLSGTVATIAFSKTGSSYSSKSGTSMACPHVAGVVALLMSASPGHTPGQIRAALESTAIDLGDPGRDDLFGYGLVDAQAARAYLLTLPVKCSLADLTEIGGTLELVGSPDGQLTVDDLLVFVNAFSEGGGCPGVGPCNPADVTGVGGPPATPDGELTVDDLIAFVNAFSEGC